MEALRALRKLLLGETWVLPLGVAAVIALALVARPLVPEWPTLGGMVILVGVLAVLALSVWSGTRRRR